MSACFHGHELVRLGSRWPRPCFGWAMRVGTPRQQVKCVGELLCGGAAKQQQRKQGPHGGDGDGAIDAAVARQLRNGMSCLAEQRMDVVAQDLGGEILRDSELRQPLTCSRASRCFKRLRASSMRQRWWYRSPMIAAGKRTASNRWLISLRGQGGGRAKCLNCQAFSRGCRVVPIRLLVKLGGLGT